MTLVLLASNVQGVQGVSRDSLEDFATLPLMKGPKGYVHSEAWWKVKGLRSFTQSRRCCTDYTRQLQRGVRSRVDTKKLDLKSNCATGTPYIVLQVSHN